MRTRDVRNVGIRDLAPLRGSMSETYQTERKGLVSYVVSSQGRGHTVIGLLGQKRTRSQQLKKTHQLRPINPLSLSRLQILHYTPPSHELLYHKQRIRIVWRQAEEFDDVGMREGTPRLYVLEDVL